MVFGGFRYLTLSCGASRWVLSREAKLAQLPPWTASCVLDAPRLVVGIPMHTRRSALTFPDQRRTSVVVMGRVRQVVRPDQGPGTVMTFSRARASRSGVRQSATASTSAPSAPSGRGVSKESRLWEPQPTASRAADPNARYGRAALTKVSSEGRATWTMVSELVSGSTASALLASADPSPAASDTLNAIAPKLL